jgi:SAM-dependent methyltransferase
MAMDDSQSQWNRYNNSVNRRDPAMSLLWVRRAVEALCAPGNLGAGARVLDFGCGYFDLGALLEDRGYLVDGYDINPETLAQARSIRSFRGQLFDSIDQLPHGAYDLIILNSVAQYFDGLGDLERHLVTFHELLRPHGRVVLSDVLPPDYNPYLDAVWSLAYATIHGCARPMISHLAAAATKGKEFNLARYDDQDISSVATRTGFTAQKLRKNYSPSIFRYTVQLSRI